MDEASRSRRGLSCAFTTCVLVLALCVRPRAGTSAAGQPGTACEGRTFPITREATGVTYDLQPDPPVVLEATGNPRSRCTISFAADVFRVPLTDARNDIPGVQRFQYGFAFGDTDDLRHAFTTIPASPTYTTIAPGSPATTVRRVSSIAYTGQPFQFVASVGPAPVAGGVPAPTGTVTGDLYDNDTCSGTAVLHSTQQLAAGSNEARPAFIANRAGNYRVVARYGGDRNFSSSSSSCSDPSATIAVVGPEPVQARLTFSPAAPEGISKITLDGSTSTGVRPLRYFWDPGDGGSYGGNTTPTFNLPFVVRAVGTFTVGLRVMDALGRISATTADIRVSDPPRVALFTPQFPEAGEPTTISATPSGGLGLLRYAWDRSGSGTFADEPSSSIQVALPAGRPSVGVRVTDVGERQADARLAVPVDERLTPQLAARPTPVAGEPFTLDASATTGGFGSRSYEWDVDDTRPGYEQRGSAPTQTVTVPASGTRAFGVRVTDAHQHARATGLTIAVLKQEDCRHSLPLGVALARTTGCMVKQSDGSLKTKDPITLNGMTLTPLDAGLVLTTSSSKIAGKVRIAAGDMTLSEQTIDWSLAAEGASKEKTLAGLQTPASGVALKGMRVSGGFSIRVGVDDAGRNYTVFGLNVGLPAIFQAGPDNSGGISGATELRVDDDGVNVRVHLDALKVEVKDAYIGRLKVAAACLSYTASGSTAKPCKPPAGVSTFFGGPGCTTIPGSERWDGSASIVLPTAGKAELSAFGGLADGKLSYIGGSLSNLGHSVPVAEGVYLNGVAMSLCLGPPIALAGTVTFTALPAGERDLLKVTGGFQYVDAYNGNPWSIAIGGSVSLFDRKVAEGTVKLQSTGTFDFHFSAGLALPTDEFDLVSVKGNVDGWIEPGSQPGSRSRFNVSGGVQVCLLHCLIEVGAKAVFSSTGVGACGGISGARVGFGYTWGGHVSLLGDACDLSPWTATRSSRQVGATPPLAVAEGDRMLAVRVKGATGPPKVLLSGPDGRTVMSSPVAAGSYAPGDHLLVENADDATTTVVIFRPAAGTWHVAALPGTSAIAAIDRAMPIAPAKITTRVSRVHGRLGLDVAYTANPGDAITFVERGSDSQRTIGVAQGKPCKRSAAAGSLCARLAFKPAFGLHRERRILAEVTRRGVPVEERVVASYDAPRARLPEPVDGLRLTRSKGGVLAIWRSARTAGHDEVYAKIGDGRRTLLTVRPGCRAIRIAHVRRDVAITAVVRGVRRDTCRDSSWPCASRSGRRAESHLRLQTGARAGTMRTPMRRSVAAHVGIEIRHLEAFVALARCRHFGDAADEVSLSQPTLSRTIAQLEERLAERLFDRSGATTRLTDAGHAFLPGAQASVDALTRAVSSARRASTTSPVLGVLNSLGFEWLPALGREIDARGRTQPELRQLAWPDGFDPLSDLVDVGIYPLPVVLPEHLTSITLGYRRPWVALPETHPLAQRSEVRLSELRGVPAIAEPAHELWMSSVALLFRAQNVEFVLGSPAISLCHVLSMIADGGGWTMAAAKGDLHLWEGVAFRPLVDVDHVRVAAVWERRRTREERVEQLVEALRAIAEREP